MAKSRGTKNSRNGLSILAIVTHFLAVVCGMYMGIAMGSFASPEVDTVERFTAEEWQKKMPIEKVAAIDSSKTNGIGPFPQTVKKIVKDYATVPRDDFNKLLEIGVPMDDTKGDEEVFILYTDERTIPFREGSQKARIKEEKIGLDPEKALENCHTVKVILQERAQAKKQCIAIVPQWESYHVHKFMRIPKQLGHPVDLKHPLIYVGRTRDDKGKESKIPSAIQFKQSSNEFLDYMEHLDMALKNLKPLVETAVDKHKTASDTSAVMKKSKVMVVMVCNKGQSHLFHNFVCNARAKGLDLSRIIMFATDKFTVDLATNLGIPVFYDEKIFGKMPEEAARRYGDRIFSKMMMAKIYCVHLVLSLGYDVLFQDVDVVWQKNPLEYLETEESKDWDMIFQDDGSRQIRYQPYSPNTGFYFVRNSKLTTYFFNNLLKQGDLIAQTKSHQAALAAKMADLVSWKGLRVKVWRKFGDTLFPGGAEYHQSKDYMRRMIAGDIKPYIFHMSWTENKDNKKLYFEQMAEWYTKDDSTKCKGLDCCLVEPIITCHYKDKPSFIPCKDSPSIDKKGKSFWK